MSVKRILVIGSNSPTAASFCAHALELGYEVIATSRSKEPHKIFLPYRWKSDKGLTFNRIDINSDLDALKELIKYHRPKYILNFAAQGMVAQSWRDPTHWMQTNVVATTALLEILRNLDFLDRYIHFTTPEVYGSTPDWVVENRNYAPSTPYALSRAAGDMAVALWTKTYNLPIIITRSANVYGEGQQLYRIIPRTFICCLTGQKLQLHGGGLSLRTFIHFEDVSRALMLICEKGNNGTDYHICTKQTIMIRELVSKVCKSVNVKFDNVVEVVDDRLGKDHAYLLDPEKITKELGWQAQISLDEGLKRCANWHHQNHDVIGSLPQNYKHKP